MKLIEVKQKPTVIIELTVGELQHIVGSVGRSCPYDAKQQGINVNTDTLYQSLKGILTKELKIDTVYYGSSSK